MEEAFQPHATLDAVADGFACYGSRLRVGAGVALADVAGTEQRRVTHLTTQDVATYDAIAMLILCIDAPEVDGHAEAIGRWLVGIRCSVLAMVPACTETKPRHACIVDAQHIAGRCEVILLEEALFAFLHPVVAVETVGVEACHNLCFPVERSPLPANLTEQAQARLVPCIGNDARLAFGTDSAEEVDGLMVSVVHADRHDEVSCTDVEVLIEVIGDVELLDGNLATLFHLGFVLAVLRVLYLEGSTCTATFELDLHADVPMAVELVIASQNKPGHGNRVSAHAGIAFAAAVEAVRAIILEGSHHLAIAADAEAVVAVYLGRVGVPLCRRSAGCEQHQGCKK